MTVSLAGPSRWPTRRWWIGLAVVFAAQIAIIFWLGETSTVPPKKTHPAPALLLPKRTADESLALADPTLFALPHLQGFSGPAWLVAPTQEFRPFAWSETPRWLGLAPEKLGEVFRQYVDPTPASPVLTLIESEPELLLPQIPVGNDFPDRSTYRVTGQLAERRLLTPVELPSWPSSEILTNSRVQMVVDANGKPVSVTLLYPGSGSKEADADAVRQAANARFAPIAGNPGSAGNSLSDLSWGQIIFDWHTVPKPSTNAIPEGKKP
jgi:hypothetical protein